jgi:hypothetical protein
MNVVPVTVDDIGIMLNSLVKGFDDYIFFGFVLMCTFSIIMFVKHLLVGGRL